MDICSLEQPPHCKVDKFHDICVPLGLGQSHPAWFIVPACALFVASTYHVTRNHTWDALSQGRKGKEHTSIVHISGQNQTHLGKWRSHWLGVSRKAVGNSEEEVGTPLEVLLGRAGWSWCPPEVPCNEIWWRARVPAPSLDNTCRRAGSEIFFLCTLLLIILWIYVISLSKLPMGLDQILIPLEALPCLALPDKTPPSLACQLD